MGNGWKIFWLVTAAIIIPGGVYAGIGVYVLTQVGYGMAGYKIKTISADSISFDVFIRVCNPSFIGADISSYDIDVFLNDTQVAKLQNSNPHTIKPKSTSILTLPINVDWRTALKTATSRDVVKYFLTNQPDKIVLRLAGTFKGKLLKVPILKKIDMNYSLADIIKIMEAPAPPPGKQQICKAA